MLAEPPYEDYLEKNSFQSVRLQIKRWHVKTYLDTGYPREDTRQLVLAGPGSGRRTEPGQLPKPLQMELLMALRT